jgi:hypothetical protein
VLNIECLERYIKTPRNIVTLKTRAVEPVDLELPFFNLSEEECKFSGRNFYVLMREILTKGVSVYNLSNWAVQESLQTDNFFKNIDLNLYFFSNLAKWKRGSKPKEATIQIIIIKYYTGCIKKN